MLQMVEDDRFGVVAGTPAWTRFAPGSGTCVT
jgi:hypothetical protein